MIKNFLNDLKEFWEELTENSTKGHPDSGCKLGVLDIGLEFTCQLVDYEVVNQPLEFEKVGEKLQPKKNAQGVVETKKNAKLDFQPMVEGIPKFSLTFRYLRSKGVKPEEMGMLRIKVLSPVGYNRTELAKGEKDGKKIFANLQVEGVATGHTFRIPAKKATEKTPEGVNSNS